MPQVEHHGIHWNGRTAWLVEGHHGRNFVGLVDDECPFKVARIHPSHHVGPAPKRLTQEESDVLDALFQHPFLKHLLPLPRPIGGQIFFGACRDRTPIQIAHVLQMSRPTSAALLPAGLMHLSKLKNQMYRTNVTPLVISDLGLRHQSFVMDVSTLAYSAPRTLVLIGDPELLVPPGITRLEMHVEDMPDLSRVDLPRLGAWVIQQYARGELPNHEF